ncbi:MAG TPA: response regulator [Candidatus Bathyarchaeia archaeon]|nr:response regulator [Candidatus Bathyarchaeia archaeon]
MARILILEDDKLLLKVYENVLTANHYEVTVAEDGETGLNKILEGGWHLILLDLKLPKKSGVEILENLQKNKPVKKNGPIVIISNVNEEKTIKKTMKLGAVGYILKDTVDLATITAEVKNYLQQAPLY